MPARTLGPEGDGLEGPTSIGERNVPLIGKAQRGQYLLVVDLGYYKWYHSQTLDDVLARRLSPEGGGHEGVCQQGCWARRGWIRGSNIDWRRERMLERTLGSKWGRLSHISWGRERIIL